MNKIERVVVMEVEVAKDKSAATPGGKYRKDSIWIIEAFRKRGVDAEIVFITSNDTAESLEVGSYYSLLCFACFRVVPQLRMGRVWCSHLGEWLSSISI